MLDGRGRDKYQEISGSRSDGTVSVNRNAYDFRFMIRLVMMHGSRCHLSGALPRICTAPQWVFPLKRSAGETPSYPAIRCVRHNSIKSLKVILPISADPRSSS